MTTLTPLRYPGGKSRLTRFIKLILEQNGLVGADYVEPFAGGAGIAINLLSSGEAGHAHINDLNPAVYAFWKSVFEEPDELCKLVRSTEVSMETWHKQRAVINCPADHSPLELGFATFFLNRTNRSGILTGGVIGGKGQLGKWKLDARYHKENLCLKIETISTYADSVTLYNMDFERLLDHFGSSLPKKSLIYLDPPYFVKSKRLYQDLYTPDDHARIAKKILKLRRPWITSYDNVPEIRELYSSVRRISYVLRYSAGDKYSGAEVLFLSPKLANCEIEDPLMIK